MLTDELSSYTTIELNVIEAIVVCLNSDQQASVRFALSASLNLTLLN